MEYPEELRERVVKMALSSGETQEALAERYGIGRSTSQKWLRDYRHNGAQGMAKREKRPQDWTAQERFAALLETATLDESALGEWCRREGLHTHHLEQWKRAAMGGMGRSKQSPEQVQSRRLQEENRRLKKELRRKEKALAETSALLVLKKKAEEIWGDDEDA